MVKPSNNDPPTPTPLTPTIRGLFPLQYDYRVTISPLLAAAFKDPSRNRPCHPSQEEKKLQLNGNKSAGHRIPLGPNVTAQSLNSEKTLKATLHFYTFGLDLVNVNLK